MNYLKQTEIISLRENFCPIKTKHVTMEHQDQKYIQFFHDSKIEEPLRNFFVIVITQCVESRK